jgi:hypothetical protein
MAESTNEGAHSLISETNNAIPIRPNVHNQITNEA